MPNSWQSTANSTATLLIASSVSTVLVRIAGKKKGGRRETEGGARERGRENEREREGMCAQGREGGRGCGGKERERKRENVQIRGKEIICMREKVRARARARK